MQYLLAFIKTQLGDGILNIFLWSIIAISWALFVFIVVLIVRKIIK